MHFSALQRAENSSNVLSVRKSIVGRGISVLFSEPKIPQMGEEAVFRVEQPDFSALQRAENSSNTLIDAGCPTIPRFQCSSASRKFLKPDGNAVGRYEDEISVLFSEPKIPQTDVVCGRALPADISVLFSEPKIPQNRHPQAVRRPRRAFQCSSASRKFLKCDAPHQRRSRRAISVLFSEPKIPQTVRRRALHIPQRISVLFSEPKIPQRSANWSKLRRRCDFSALQRAENSSNSRAVQVGARPDTISVLFSEPKIPQCNHLCDLPRRLLVFQCSSASRKFLN